MMRATRSTSGGFTLIEVLISISITIILLWAIMATLAQNMTSWKFVQTRMAFDQVVEETRVALSKKSVCKMNFSGANVDLVSRAPISFNRIQYFDASGNATESLLSAGQRFIDQTILSIEIVPRVQTAVDQAIGDLVIKTAPSPSSPSLVRSIVILLYLNANQLIDCTTGIDSDMEILEKSCAISSGGKTTWDSNTESCKFTGAIMKRGGDILQSKCSPGEVVAEFLPDRCHAICPPSADPAGVITRVYEDGTVVTQQPIAAACVMSAPDTCECHYAPGVDSNQCQTYAYCTKE